jgi:hypothetical protein
VPGCSIPPAVRGASRCWLRGGSVLDGMLTPHHVRESARGAGLTNFTTLSGAVEDLAVPARSFDAVIDGPSLREPQG